MIKTDGQKTGALLYKLRSEKGMTQLQLARLLYVSDKAISKWERGLGCPDVSLLGELAEIFGVNVESILQGELSTNDIDGGNMKRVKFFACPECGNILTGTGDAQIICCGRRLTALTPQAADDAHSLQCEKVEDDCYVTSPHEMTKEHYISFAAFVSYDRLLLIKLYPEQNCEVRFPKRGGGKLVWYCTKDGLFEKRI